MLTDTGLMRGDVGIAVELRRVFIGFAV